MLRKIYDPNSGADVTSSVQAQLQAGRTFVIATLFSFQVMNFWHYNPNGDPYTFTFTDADFPIAVNYAQTLPTGVTTLGTWSGGVFTPGALTFRPEVLDVGDLEYDIGFTDHPVEVNWWPDDNFNYGGLNVAVSPVNLTMRQALATTAFNEAACWIHHAIFTDFPSKGGTFLGTSLMFRGFLRKVHQTRGAMVLTLASLLDLFQSTQIPTQTLVPGNRALPYIPAAPIPAFGIVDVLTILSPVSQNFHWNFGNWNVARDVYKDAWITYAPFVVPAFYPWQIVPAAGLPPPPMWRLSGNEPSSNGDLVVYFYEPPIVPSGQTVTAFGQFPNAGGNVGFPFVPPPELSL